MPSQIQKFEDLPPEWDLAFLPEMSRSAKLTPTTHERFVIHFGRENLPRLFQYGERNVLQLNQSFQSVVEEVLRDGYTFDVHRKSRADYLSKFRENLNVPIRQDNKGKNQRESSLDLLKWLLEEWTRYSQERQILTPKQRFAKFLLKLNCRYPKRTFKDVRIACNDYNRWASAFLVRINPHLRNWVTCLLLQYIDNLLTAKIIRISGKKLKKSPDIFRQSIAESVGLGVDSPSDDILKGLRTLAKSQQIIFIVDEINLVSSLRVFKEEFWDKLVEMIEDEKKDNQERQLRPLFEGHITLLMISTPDEELRNWQMSSCEGRLPENSLQLSQLLRVPIALEPITQIKNSEVRTWLREDAVKQFLIYQIGQERFSMSYQEMSQELDDMPYRVINNICDKFEFDLDDIDLEWEERVGTGDVEKVA